MTSGFESTKGAIERLGTEDVEGKLIEIENEKKKRQESFDIYGGGFEQRPRASDFDDEPQEE